MSTSYDSLMQFTGAEELKAEAERWQISFQFQLYNGKNNGRHFRVYHYFITSRKASWDFLILLPGLPKAFLLQ